jgi:hypothetical protein
MEQGIRRIQLEPLTVHYRWELGYTSYLSLIVIIKKNPWILLVAAAFVTLSCLFYNSMPGTCAAESFCWSSRRSVIMHHDLIRPHRDFCLFSSFFREGLSPSQPGRLIHSGVSFYNAPSQGQREPPKARTRHKTTICYSTSGRIQQSKALITPFWSFGARA